MCWSERVAVFTFYWCLVLMIVVASMLAVVMVYGVCREIRGRAPVYPDPVCEFCGAVLAEDLDDDVCDGSEGRRCRRFGVEVMGDE